MIEPSPTSELLEVLAQKIEAQRVAGVRVCGGCAFVLITSEHGTEEIALIASERHAAVTHLRVLLRHFESIYPGITREARR